MPGPFSSSCPARPGILSSPVMPDPIGHLNRHNGMVIAALLYVMPDLIGHPRHCRLDRQSKTRMDYGAQRIHILYDEYEQ